MSITETTPEQLSERELFTKFVEISDKSADSKEGYSKAHLQARHANLLAEIGERLETLEAMKALLSDDESERKATSSYKQNQTEGYD
jgi:hypothetical protein